MFKEFYNLDVETWENDGKWKKRLDILGGRNGIGKDTMVKRGKEGFTNAQTIVVREKSFSIEVSKDTAFP